MGKTQDSFNVKEAIVCIPNTNPFLKRLMEECLGESSERHLNFDELEVANVVEILTHTNTDLILADFNRQTGGGREDPVIHFYEEFLTAYDKAQKVQRGVYYTPQPVVNFIVRAVDSILKTEFGLADGLASEETKIVKYMREKIRGQSMTEDTKEVPAVQILDPATGTGTFLRQTILQIYDNVRAKHKGESEEQIKKAWNEYVPKHLLPRLNGFELMMAPYAVAHMKLAMVLEDTGYDFGGDHRLNVFLTNSLEEANGMVEVFDDGSVMTSMFDDPLAFESAEANQAKKNNGINVIIGNPPYSGISSNNNAFIAKLIEDYKYIDDKHFNERKHWLNDDYVKFIRYAQSLIERAGSGILAYICPHGFLDNPTFRAMRWNLLQTFEKIYVSNLHGNINRGEKCPDGSKDENVFDIEQGVSINIFIKNQKNTSKSKINHTDLYGIKELKYKYLQSKVISDIAWKKVDANSPYYLFVPNSISETNDYWEWINIDDLFIKNTTGIVTMGDKFIVADTAKCIEARIKDFIETDYTTTAFKEKYHLGKNYPNFALSNKKHIEYSNDKIIRLCYRPFDNKYTYYDRMLIWRARDDVSPLFSIGDNIGLITARNNKAEDCSHFFIADCMSEAKCGERTTQSVIYPLYSFSHDFTTNRLSRTPNLNSNIVSSVSKSLGLPYKPNSDGNESDSIAPINLLDYIYAIVYSAKYREKYKEFLKIDFPRVPYPTNQATFWKLVEIGGKLRKCHLMHTKFDTAAYSFVGDGTNEVVKPEYKNGRMYISKTQYFDNVPQAQWEQYIGGYQPLQKWLKDRKKTTLSAEDIEHYKKIIAALRLTEELMAEIDQVVEF